MKKIKVLYIIATLDIGGTERQLVELAKRIDKERYEPAICCLTRGGPLEKELQNTGIEVHILHKKGKWDFGIILKLFGLIRRKRPDIVHTFLWTSNAWGRIAALLAGVPVIISSERSTDLWKGWFEFSIDRILSLFTRRVIVNSCRVKEFIKAKGIEESRIAVVYNGIDTGIYNSSCNSIELRNSLGLDAKRPVIGYIGRLSYEKNPQLFVKLSAQILQKRKDVQFLIVGDGELRNEVEEKIGEYNLRDHIKIAGYRKDVPRILQAIDVVVLTSLWEGLPNSLIEAGASSRPAVSFDVGGVREIIADGKTGFVIPAFDEKSFVDKVIFLLDNPDLAKKMGEEGKKIVQEKFEISKTVKSIEKIYEFELAQEEFCIK